MPYKAIIDTPQKNKRRIFREITYFTEGYIEGEVKRRLLEQYGTRPAFYIYFETPKTKDKALAKKAGKLALVAFKPVNASTFTDYTLRG